MGLHEPPSRVRIQRAQYPLIEEYTLNHGLWLKSLYKAPNDLRYIPQLRVHLKSLAPNDLRYIP